MSSSESSQAKKLACGVAVVRGPDWVHGKQDGKEKVGVNLRACEEGDWTLVRWKSGKYKNRAMPYRYGVKSSTDDNKKLFEIQGAENEPPWSCWKPNDWGREQVLGMPKGLDHDGTTYVGITIEVMRIGGVDTVKQTFSAKLHIDLDWEASPEDLWEYFERGNKSKFEPKWAPRLIFPTEVERANEMMMETERGSPYRLTWRAPQERTECWTSLRKKIHQRCRNVLCLTVTRMVDVVLADRFQMKHFPVDCQDLKIVVQSYDPISRCQFCPYGRLITDEKREKIFCQVRRDTFTASDWLLKKACVSIDSTNPQLNVKNESYSLLIVRLKLQRK